ncbi:MAG: VOC family protein [Patescibacteria group bacterium]
MKRQWKFLGYDHATVCVTNIEGVVNFYVETMGAVVVYRNPDTNPLGKSSMVLYGLALDNTLLAIAQGIDREEIAHPTRFVERHGYHAYQHIAIRVDNIDAFITAMQSKGVQFLSPLYERTDPFGKVKQIFALPFDPFINPEAAPFYEYVERPPDWSLKKLVARTRRGLQPDIFSDTAAEKLFDAIQHAGYDRPVGSFFGDNFFAAEELSLGS